MIRRLSIRNYKSILDQTIDLGRINVFIGENGCGKTNILESVGMMSAALDGKLALEDLFARGIRVADPSLITSAFTKTNSDTFEITCKAESFDEIKCSLSRSTEPNRLLKAVFPEQKRPTRPDTLKDLDTFKKKSEVFAESLKTLKWEKEKSGGGTLHLVGNPSLISEEEMAFFVKLMLSGADRFFYNRELGEFAIYNPNALALRGLETSSRRLPLGTNGENLDTAMASLPRDAWKDVVKEAHCVSWLDKINIASEEQEPPQQPQRGKSKLFFGDRFIAQPRARLSAGSTNEGILHVLFHLTLFSSKSTPRVLGIDNLDTALNPQLCRDLVTKLATLAVQHDKQALITTHNPATLDGLNLLDDEQRLFVVSRNSKGHTTTKRIIAKPAVEGRHLKLSELWTRGHLGGLPRNF